MIVYMMKMFLFDFFCIESSNPEDPLNLDTQPRLHSEF